MLVTSQHVWTLQSSIRQKEGSSRHGMNWQPHWRETNVKTSESTHLMQSLFTPFFLFHPLPTCTSLPPTSFPLLLSLHPSPLSLPPSPLSLSLSLPPSLPPKGYVPALEARAIISLQMGNLFGAMLDITAALKVCWLLISILSLRWLLYHLSVSLGFAKFNGWHSAPIWKKKPLKSCRTWPYYLGFIFIPTTSVYTMYAHV